MKNIDILNMLTQKQLDELEDVFYSFIGKFGYKVENKFDEKELEQTKKQMQRNKDIFIRNYDYDYDNKKVLIQFVRRKYRSKKIIDKSNVVVLNITGKTIEKDLRGEISGREE